MKKLLILNILLLACAILPAQTFNNTTVYTPKSTAVEGKILTSGELSSAQKSAAKSQTLSAHPNATFLADATWTYNCHGYAWHISEGGSPTVWINEYDASSSPNVYRYWTDGSYIQVCNQSECDKVHYYSGDHSAVNSTIVSGKYESKWGANIRIRHDPTDVPAIYNGTYRNYYASTKINGNTSNFCSGTRTFSVKSITGATYSWTYSSGLVASGPVNQSSINIQRNGSATGMQWLQVVITSPCSGSGATTKVDIPVGVPVVLTGTYSVNSGTTKTMNTVNFLTNGYVYAQYSWPGISGISASAPSGIGFFSTSSSFSFTLGINQSVSVNFTGTGACGETQYATRTFVYSSNPFRLAASPNPAKENITLTVSKTDDIFINQQPEQLKNTTGNSKGITRIYLYNMYTNLLVKQWVYHETKANSYNLNIAGLKGGVYLLKMERDNKISSTKVIVQ